MEAAVIQLLNRLEEIGRPHGELYDTDVKEQTGQWFVDVFFNGEVNLPAPAEYGMFSEKGNEAVNAAFAEFAKRLRESSSFAALPENEKWRIFREAATAITREPAEAFFGALEPNTFVDLRARQQKTRHWLQASYVYLLFLVCPGMFIFLVGALVFPTVIEGPVNALVFVIVAGAISLIVGDSIWQFLSNNTYRRQDDNVA